MNVNVEAENSMEMPRYQCYEKVWALKIKEIEHKPGEGAIITPSEEGFAPFPVDSAYMMKCNPHVGGYYIVHSDGQRSFRLKGLFELGHARLED